MTTTTPLSHDGRILPSHQGRIHDVRQITRQQGMSKSRLAQLRQVTMHFRRVHNGGKGNALILAVGLCPVTETKASESLISMKVVTGRKGSEAAILA